MGIEKKSCKVKIFQPQSMSNAIRCIDQRFAFKNLGISCLALIFNLEQQNAVLQRRVINQYLARDRYERMAQWLRHFLVSQATWNGFSQGAETPCRP